MKRAISVAGLAAVLLLSLAWSSDSDVWAKSKKSKGAAVTGSWFVTTPAGLTQLITYGKDGTVTGVASVVLGGLPLPGANRSGDHGVWRKLRGGLFESAMYRFEFDLTTGDVTAIIRLRFVLSLDRGHDSGTGEFFITRWHCPAAVMCPDPNVAAPTVGEFAPPANTFTMTRMKLP